MSDQIEIPKCEHFKSERNLSMALIRNPDGSGFWRARIYFGPTVDYPEEMFGTMAEFVEYCRHNHELQAIERDSFEAHGIPGEPDWEELRKAATEYTEAKRKAEEADRVYKKAVAFLDKRRKSKWIIPGLIRKP